MGSWMGLLFGVLWWDRLWFLPVVESLGNLKLCDSLFYLCLSGSMDVQWAALRVV